MSPKEKRQPPLVLMHPVVNSVHILKLITEFNQVHVMIILVVRIQTQKVSIMYHFYFGVIHVPYFLNPLNSVATNKEKVNRLCVIN